MPALLALSTTAQPRYALKFAEMERGLFFLATMATQSVAMAAAAPVKSKPDISVSEVRLVRKTTAADLLPRR